MPKYLLHVNFIGEGIKGLLSQGGGRSRLQIRRREPRVHVLRAR